MTQYFVKMFKDGSYKIKPVPDKLAEIDQSTMELEYFPPPPTEQEKVNYALGLPEVAGLQIPDDLKRQVAIELIKKPDFVMPVFDPNASRVHPDPEYFFKTPCVPVIWTFYTGMDKMNTEDDVAYQRRIEKEAIAEAEKYRQEMLKKIVVYDYPDPGIKDRIETTKWDMVVKVYKEQYNVLEG